MIKKELRKLYQQKRSTISTQQKLKMDDLLLIQFQRLYFEDPEVVLNYFPLEVKGEINTHLFERFMMHSYPEVQVAYPVINFSTTEMTAVLVDENTEFVENAYGIAEPQNGVVINPEIIDVVFVPLLAFDNLGYRVGYGKGFYDRFLKHCRTDVITVGFSYFEAEDKIDDTNQFDVPLNYCITPQKLYEF